MHFEKCKLTGLKVHGAQNLGDDNSNLNYAVLIKKNIWSTSSSVKKIILERPFILEYLGACTTDCP